ncbi:MAG: large subunit ribosomal protein [Candidatus Atribacteria bacterium]|jgi:large subunit ribosomal protein L21|nr:large subunit ribosomal protein [Candidatus Atribacteria bacterium]MDI3530166.1 large subunit ribosomal protein [Candidatus Atribacteria bacterium]
MLAIIEAAGKQFLVKEGSTVKLDSWMGDKGEKVVFERVLMVKDGDQISVGTPYLEGVKVRGTVLEKAKDRKVLVFKYKPKKNYRRKIGHRQPKTLVYIEAVETS